MASKLSTLISALTGKVTPVDADKIPILDSENSSNHNWVSFANLKSYFSSTYATAAQGSTADTAIQPGDDAADLGSGAATDGQVLTADGAGGAAWEAAAVTYAGAASEIHAATDKATPVDADELGLSDSAASWVLKKLSWANVVATVKTALKYFVDSTNVSVGSTLLPSLTTGTGNTLIGLNTGLSLTEGTGNSCVGSSAGRSITTGSNNALTGLSSGYSITSGISNSCFGMNAGYSILTGKHNSCLGTNSGRSISTGSFNACFGIDAGRGTTTGSNNVFFGKDAGRYHADGSTELTDPESCIYIGTSARGKNNADSNSVVIGGNTPIGLGANTTVIGTSSTTLTRLYGNLGLGVDSPSAAIHTIKTTEQLRLGYDATYYASFTVSSAGNLTLTNAGTTIYTDKVIENTVAGAGVILKSPDGTRYLLTVANGGTLSIAAA